MKLVRYGKAGKEKPGLVDAAGKIRDLSEVIADIDGSTLGPKSLARLAKLKPESLPAVRGTPRIGPCVGKVGHFIAVGLNYADHAAESSMPIPAEPILFSKAPSCIVGPNDDVIIPKGSKKTDWEVEIAVVIGTRASYVGQGQRSVACRGLLRVQRRLGARIPARKVWPVDQRQERPDLRPARAVARHA